MKFGITMTGLRFGVQQLNSRNKRQNLAKAQPIQHCAMLTWASPSPDPLLRTEEEAYKLAQVVPLAVRVLPSVVRTPLVARTLPWVVRRVGP